MLSIILSLLLTTSGLQITITAPAGCHPCYVQLDGGNASPSIYQFDLDAGESFGATSQVQSGSVRVRVWTDTGGMDAVADQTTNIPAPYRVYVPLF